jgi:hypothetical protein
MATTTSSVPIHKSIILEEDEIEEQQKSDAEDEEDATEDSQYSLLNDDDGDASHEAGADDDDDGEGAVQAAPPLSPTHSSIPSTSANIESAIPPNNFIALNDDSDEEEEQEDFNKKFISDTKEDYIKKYHPELAVLNNEEVDSLALVVRNSEGKIIDQLHKTIPILTKFEKTRVLGFRAKQINNGNRC